MDRIPKKQQPLPVRIVHADNHVDNHAGGTVNIITRKVGRPPKPQKLTKGDPKPIRFYPKDEKTVMNAVNAEWNSYQEFGEFWLSEVATVYGKNQAIKLAKYFHQIAPVLDVFPD